MKRLVLTLAIASSNAMALDFDTEWAKFSGSFAKLKPSTDKTVVHASPQPVEDSLMLVDPKSPERLGLKLSDPAMRDKVTKLYQKPDVVVYSTTIR
jgi:hypothetical protein